jgi:hypothetical protein
MTLSLGFTSPRDVLAKAQRDCAKLSEAVLAQDVQRIGDALHEFAVAVVSVKDWLKAESGPSLIPKDVEKLVDESVALTTFRDIANTIKHRLITRYVPTTSEVLLSVPATKPTRDAIKKSVLSSKPQQSFKVKVVLTDKVSAGSCLSCKSGASGMGKVFRAPRAVETSIFKNELVQEGNRLWTFH